MKVLLIVLFIIMCSGVSTDEINLLTSDERIEYNNKIKNWSVPIIIPEFKRPLTGWENRFNR